MLGRLREIIRRDSREDSLPVPAMLVVGLGNPGPKYAATRHNIGFRIVEHLAARHGGEWVADPEIRSMTCLCEISGRSVGLLAPQTYVNRSGEAVLAALDRWPALDPTRDLLIVYDELDLRPGRIRLRPSGGGGGHNGIRSILTGLGTKEVARLRFGIGHPGSSDAVIDWVLEPFSGDEESEVLPSAIAWAADAVEAAIGEGVPAAMGRFNAVRKSGPPVPDNL